MDLDNTTAETLSCTVLPLKHLSRVKIRETLRNQLGNKLSSQCYIEVLNTLRVPQIIKEYLRYK